MGLGPKCRIAGCKFLGLRHFTSPSQRSRASKFEASHWHSLWVCLQSCSGVIIVIIMVCVICSLMYLGSEDIFKGSFLPHMTRVWKKFYKYSDPKTSQKSRVLAWILTYTSWLSPVLFHD